MLFDLVSRREQFFPVNNLYLQQLHLVNSSAVNYVLMKVRITNQWGHMRLIR
jgi:hypothetical protein